MDMELSYRPATITKGESSVIIYNDNIAVIYAVIIYNDNIAVVYGKDGGIPLWA